MSTLTEEELDLLSAVRVAALEQINPHIDPACKADIHLELKQVAAYLGDSQPSDVYTFVFVLEEVPYSLRTEYVQGLLYRYMAGRYDHSPDKFKLIDALTVSLVSETLRRLDDKKECFIDMRKTNWYTQWPRGIVSR